jgi:hypothetical protein
VEGEGVGIEVVILHGEWAGRAGTEVPQRGVLVIFRRRDRIVEGGRLGLEK